MQLKLSREARFARRRQWHCLHEKFNLAVTCLARFPVPKAILILFGALSKAPSLATPLLKDLFGGQGLVAQVCGPRYLRGREWEDLCSRPTKQKVYKILISTNGQTQQCLPVILAMQGSSRRSPGRSRHKVRLYFKND
jgi:hypothetical protein